MNRWESMGLFLLFCAVCSLPVEPKEQLSGQILGGSPEAPIRMEVFSDFQCPSCRELYLESIRRVLADYSSVNKVCVIYHEFPLSTHRYSREAARYAEAASRFGRQKLLMVYDAIFLEQAKWSADGDLETAVSKVLTRQELLELKKILQDPSINAAIDKEIQLGVQRQIRSTPTYFISSRKKQEKVEGYLTYASLKQVLDPIF
jgi:protein-disulfide isomerase